MVGRIASELVITYAYTEFVKVNLITLANAISVGTVMTVRRTVGAIITLHVLKGKAFARNV